MTQKILVHLVKNPRTGNKINIKKLKDYTNLSKKYNAEVLLPSGQLLTVPFGQMGYEDYTMHKDDKRKKNYLTRHDPIKTGENWADPTTPGFWSRWLLWNKPTIEASKRDIEQRFNIKFVNTDDKSSSFDKTKDTFAQVQAIIFERDLWTVESSEAWIKNYTSLKPIKEAHLTKNFIRWRIQQPEQFAGFATYEIDGEPGIKIIIGYPH